MNPASQPDSGKFGHPDRLESGCDLNCRAERLPRERQRLAGEWLGRNHLRTTPAGRQRSRACAALPVTPLESFGIYKLARQVLDEFWDDSELLGKDYRGRELAKQQVRSLDSVCANIEDGFGRGFGKELPQHLKIARGEARESRGRYERCLRLLTSETIAKRTETFSRIIGGLTKTIRTIESRQARQR